MKMFDLKTQKLPLGKSLFKDEITNVKSVYTAMAIEIKKQIKEQLQFRLNNWTPSSKVLEVYPFFKNINKLISDYDDCLVVLSNKEDFISVAIDVGKLKEKGLPENLRELLEYGNNLIPPFPHIRTVLHTVRTVVNKELEGVIGKSA